MNRVSTGGRDGGRRAIRPAIMEERGCGTVCLSRRLIFLIAALCILVFIPAAQATHFRFGTISWCTMRDRFTKRRIENTVLFRVSLAFKRNYEWGKWYGEQWSPDKGKTWRSTISERRWQNFNYDPTVDYTRGYALKFPVVTGPFGLPLMPPGNPRQCDTPFEHAGNASEGLPCSPWSETAGWFFGDGTSMDLVLPLTEVVFELSRVGNYLRGAAVFNHTYSAPRNPISQQPWLAYFTGGNRIRELNNNANGRYRLETTIDIYGDNCSPVAKGLPVLPVPYTPRNIRSQYGFGITFQVAAYDPDLRDYGVDPVYFRIGTRAEHGYILQHILPGSVFITWTREDYEREKAAVIARAIAAARSPPVMAEWDDNIDYAKAPDDMVIDTLSGIVNWEAGLNPFEADPNPYQNGTFPELPLKPPKPSGFYNLVVMVSSPTQDVDAAAGLVADFDGNVSIPIDFLLYLYPNMHYCSIECAPSNGIQTFTTSSQRNTYGDYKGPDSSQWVYDGPGTGKCAICGGGEAQEYLVNASVCKPTLTTLSDPEEQCTGGCPAFFLNEAGEGITYDGACDRTAARGGTPATVVPDAAACKLNM